LRAKKRSTRRNEEPYLSGGREKLAIRTELRNFTFFGEKKKKREKNVPARDGKYSTGKLQGGPAPPGQALDRKGGRREDSPGRTIKKLAPTSGETSWRKREGHDPRRARPNYKYRKKGKRK